MLPYYSTVAYKERLTMNNELLLKRLNSRLPQYKCTIETFEKPQKTYEGLQVFNRETGVGVCFELSWFKDEDEAVNKVEEYMLRTKPDFDLDFISDYSLVKEQLETELIPIETNTQVLEKIPHRRFLDRALIPRICTVAGSVLITNDLLSRWGISEERLIDDAVGNASKEYALQIRNIFDYLDIREPVFYIAGTGRRFGASVMAYPGFIEEAAKTCKGAFYIIPSSIDEVLLFPETPDTDPQVLKDMVRSVNRETLKPEERLSDTVYYYDGEKIRIQ